MKKADAIGLIINPKAGHGFAVNAQAALAVVSALQPDMIFTGAGELGADAFTGAVADTITVLPVLAAAGRAQTQALAVDLAKMPISALVVIGGDGTLADVACALIDIPDAAPILGIGAGSTNAGSLVACRVDALQQLDPARLELVSRRALLALEGDDTLGIGFNDCVLGFTVVGTLEGVVQDVDAAAKFKGKIVPGKPATIGTSRTRLLRSGPDGIVQVASGKKVATVVAGFAEQAFFAKAVTGGVCLAALTGVPAGCLVADQPLVRIGIDQQQVLALPPIASTYVSFNETQRIQVSGVKKGAAVCVDGNPLKLLGPQDTVEFGVASHAIRSYRLL